MLGVSFCVDLMAFRKVTTSEENIIKSKSKKYYEQKGDPVKDDVTGEMIKGGGDIVVDWILRLCNMVSESSVGPEDWRSTVIIPLYKDKGERTVCMNYRCISLLNVVGKIYAGILVDRVCRVNSMCVNERSNERGEDGEDRSEISR